MNNEIKLVSVASEESFNELKKMILEYAKDLGVDLCFQNFAEELDALPKHYGLPFGASALLMDDQGVYFGCVGIRKFKDNAAELKRMYVRKSHRGKGCGEELLKFSIEAARKLSYQSLRFDTLKILKPAISLYKKYGFKEIEAYRDNPYDDVVYMELKL